MKYKEGDKVFFPKLETLGTWFGDFHTGIEINKEYIVNLTGTFNFGLENENVFNFKEYQHGWIPENAVRPISELNQFEVGKRLDFFPGEGCCESLDPRLAKYLCNRPGAAPDNGVAKTDATGIGWNMRSHWWIKNIDNSGKTRYKLEELEQFLPKETIVESIPEYVECIENSDGYTTGKVYKTLSTSTVDRYKTIDDKGRSNGWTSSYFKPSTKEAWEAQNKPKLVKPYPVGTKILYKGEEHIILGYVKDEKYPQTLVEGPAGFHSGLGTVIVDENEQVVSLKDKKSNKVFAINSELKPIVYKSLVGRYVKALENRVDGSDTKIGNYYLITAENTEYILDCKTAPFISKNSLNKFELMPEGWKPEQDLLDEAKRRYPKGTKFKNPVPDHNKVHIVEESDPKWNYQKNGIHVSATDGRAAVYYEGKWAEIIEEPSNTKYIDEAFSHVNMGVGQNERGELIAVPIHNHSSSAGIQYVTGIDCHRYPLTPKECAQELLIPTNPYLLEESVSKTKPINTQLTIKSKLIIF